MEGSICPKLWALWIPPVRSQVNLDLLRKIETIGFSIRIINALRDRGIRLLGELIPYTAKQLLRWKGFSEVSLAEVERVLFFLEMTLETQLTEEEAAAVEAERNRLEEEELSEIKNS